MCIAAPGRITKVKGREVEVEYPGAGKRRAMLSRNKVKVGDWVMVQMGIVMQVLDSKEAKELLKGWKMKGYVGSDG